MALYLLFLLAFLVKATSAGNIVTTLPGYTGELPFTLETGYVGVGENEDVQLFYYFVESQGNPTQDPLLLWITGGPGCSSIRAFFYEFGPILIDYENYAYDGSLPTLIENQYAWTKDLNIIYFDGPVGTGFSYSKTEQGAHTGDYLFAEHTRDFIQKWLLEHPQFLGNELYIGGDGYSGNTIPLMVQNILDSNEAKVEPIVNMRGYVLVSPGTYFEQDFNSRIPYVHRMGFISNRIYKAAKTSCNGNYMNVTGNAQCASDMNIVNELIDNINTAHILENSCKDVDVDGLQLKLREINLARRSLKEKSIISLNSLLDGPKKFCRKVIHSICTTWANNEDVQKALYVKEGTKTSWSFCNETIDDDDTIYHKNVSNVVDYHRNFSKTGMRAIIFSGDHDMDIPNISTQKWIWTLNLTLDERWRVWSVDNETAGYTRKFSNGNFSLTYATVKGAGHFAPEYKPHECYEMMDRWLADKPL